MKYDFVYNSEKLVYPAEVKIDREKESEVRILFEKQEIILIADCNGNTRFCDLNLNVIFEDKAESDKYFSRVYVGVDKGKVFADFPVTEWIDHYPNCDGEYDRWSERIVDNIYIYCPAK